MIANAVSISEVKGRTFHHADLSCRNRRLVYRQIVVSIDFADHVFYRRRRVCRSCQREIAVAGQVYNRLLIGCCRIINDQFIIIRQRIHHRSRQFAREAFLIVRRNVTQDEAVLVYLFRLPNASVETRRPAVQMVFAVIDGQMIFFSVQAKAPFSYTVGIAAHERTQERLIRVQVILEFIVSLYNIGKVALVIRSHNRNDCSPIIRYGHFQAVLIGKKVEVYGFPADFLLKIFLAQTTKILFVFHNAKILNDCNGKFGNKIAKYKAQKAEFSTLKANICLICSLFPFLGICYAVNVCFLALILAKNGQTSKA